MKEIRVNDEYYYEEEIFDKSLAIARFNLKYVHGIKFRLTKKLKQEMLNLYRVEDLYYDCGDLCWDDNFTEVWNKVMVRELEKSVELD